MSLEVIINDYYYQKKKKPRRYDGSSHKNKHHLWNDVRRKSKLHLLAFKSYYQLTEHIEDREIAFNDITGIRAAKIHTCKLYTNLAIFFNKQIVYIRQTMKKSTSQRRQNTTTKQLNYMHLAWLVNHLCKSISAATKQILTLSGYLGKKEVTAGYFSTMVVLKLHFN